MEVFRSQIEELFLVIKVGEHKVVAETNIVPNTIDDSANARFYYRNLKNFLLGNIPLDIARKVGIAMGSLYTTILDCYLTNDKRLKKLLTRVEKFKAIFDTTKPEVVSYVVLTNGKRVNLGKFFESGGYLYKLGNYYVLVTDDGTDRHFKQLTSISILPSIVKSYREDPLLRADFGNVKVVSDSNVPLAIVIGKAITKTGVPAIVSALSPTIYVRDFSSSCKYWIKEGIVIEKRCPHKWQRGKLYDVIANVIQKEKLDGIRII